MEGSHLKGRGGVGDPPWPQLLELIPSKREWMVRDRGGGGEVANVGYGLVVEKQLELRLGPPGGGGDVGLSSGCGGGGGGGGGGSSRETKMEPCSLLSLGGVFSSGGSRNCRPGGTNPPPSAGAKRGFLDTLEDCKQQAAYQPHKAGFFGAGCACKEDAAAHKASGGNTEAPPPPQQQQHRPGDRKAAAASPPTTSSPAPSANAAGDRNDRSQTRASQPPVVGWPPIRSFRKNIAAASSSKSPSSPPPNANEQQKAPERSSSSRLVKINMDGVPIGRKVDLGACVGYERLSAAVDQLFKGLLAAQRVMMMDHCNNSTTMCSSEQESSSSSGSSSTPAITGLLDGSGEYTLVYEDNEGDRMLVGDVPWEMFVSTVKRLRVLKTSELPSLSLGVGGGTRRSKAPTHHHNHHRDPTPAPAAQRDAAA